MLWSKRSSAKKLNKTMEELMWTSSTLACASQTNYGWDNWQIAFVNKLNASMGAANVPIDYVVCPDVDEDDFLFFDDNEESRRYQMPLEGQNLKHDNKRVYKTLKTACLDADAWPWISKNNGNDRSAWLKLVGHYGG